MTEWTCTRCDRSGNRMPATPLPGDLGSRIYDTVCNDCWQEWLKEQTAIINHFALNVLDPKAKQLLTEKTREFLFGEEP
ncbi:MAG: oxidative damage protection protein [Gemmatimonadetes bacterium]|nr:oxidative damage protection protein [Gemmatimonadota bacterium]MCH7489860.1 oxidative damage protection protein [Gemmatimonadota bacterium]MCH7715205.1 oxidative damage protection protein [Gemmatimonadota bacterium]